MSEHCDEFETRTERLQILAQRRDTYVLGVLLGGSMWASSDVMGRLAKPMRRVVRQRVPILLPGSAGPGPSQTRALIVVGVVVGGWVSAVADAELVSVRVGHQDPGGPMFVRWGVCDARGAESGQSVCFGVDVVGVDVQVHAVLGGFGVGDSLEEQLGAVTGTG